MLPVESLSGLRARIGPAQRLTFARNPTPISLLPALSRSLGASIYCMRDDQTFGAAGDEVRKLEYLLHEARKLGSDTLVTCDSHQSNWCTLTALLGAALDMETELVLGSRTSLEASGSVRLMRQLGVGMRHIDTADEDQLEAASREVTRELQSEGLRPYRIVQDGSSGLGALAYVEAFDEIVQFEQSAGVSFSKVIHATRSAATQAGLIAGAMLHDWPGEIIGIPVSRSAAEQRRKVLDVLRQIIDDPLIETSLIQVDDAFAGGGCELQTPACLDAIDAFARTEGIALDSDHSCRAAAALLAHGRDGKLVPDENVLLLLHEASVTPAAAAGASTLSGAYTSKAKS